MKYLGTYMWDIHIPDEAGFGLGNILSHICFSLIFHRWTSLLTKDLVLVTVTVTTNSDSDSNSNSNSNSNSDSNSVIVTVILLTDPT